MKYIKTNKRSHAKWHWQILAYVRYFIWLTTNACVNNDVKEPLKRFKTLFFSICRQLWLWLDQDILDVLQVVE